MKGVLLILLGLISIQVSIGAEVNILDEALDHMSTDQKVALVEALLREEEAQLAVPSSAQQADATVPYFEKEAVEMKSSDTVEHFEKEAAAVPPFSSYDDLIEESLKRQHLEKLQARANADKSESPQSYAMRKLSHYLKQTPNLKIHSRTARAHIDALRTYKAAWERKRGNTNFTELLEEVRQFRSDPTAFHTEEITLRPDQPFEPEEGICYIITRDCGRSTDNRYRSFDGSCNNLRNPNIGSTERPMRRKLDRDYADHIFSPRESSSSAIHRLPNAREVSIFINEQSGIEDDDEENRKSPINTLHMMQIGQFLDHDVTHTPANGDPDDITCRCGEPVTPTCFPIPLEDRHGFGDCIPFPRSLPILNENCDPDKIEQSNSLTPWVDGSHIYGTSLEHAKELRDHTSFDDFGRVHGRMAVSENPKDEKIVNDLLPQNKNDCEEDDDEICKFETGDIRANEQPGLTSMHTIFVRLHNVFEENMYRFNRHFDSETLYQETRRLVIAVWQRIAFNEYLQVILGRTAFEHFMMHDSVNRYDARRDPTIANEFATVAFRFGHTEIPDVLPYIDHSRDEELLSESPLDDVFFNPVDLYLSPVEDVSGVDALMTGFAGEHAEKFDSYFSDTIRNHLFGGGDRAPGMDLPALNIQRAREHGIPGYGRALEYCGLQLSSRYLRPEVRSNFLEKYGNGRVTAETLYNIDLFAAGVAETPLRGAQVGPTFACLIGEQFGDIKNGDRFYFTHEEAGFTEEQVENIKQYTLASALCDSMDRAHYMQEKAMLLPWEGRISNRIDRGLLEIYRGETNELKLCGELPHIDFRLFAQEP